MGGFLCNTFSSWWLGSLWPSLGCRQGSAGFQWLEGFWLFPKWCCKSVTFPWPSQGNHGQVTLLPGHLGNTLRANADPRAVLSPPIPNLAEDTRQPLCHPADGKLRQGAVLWGQELCPTDVGCSWSPPQSPGSICTDAPVVFPPSPPVGKPRVPFWVGGEGAGSPQGSSAWS